ncbi:MAG: hypothetical protein CMJ46_14155 [Planctomyces sp.]|nr:hypothetical protein [Planctomyces sp.]
MATPHPRWFHPWKSFSTESLITLAEVEQRGGNMLLVVWLIGCCGTSGLILFRHHLINRFLNRCQELNQHSEAGAELFHRLMDAKEEPIGYQIKGRSVRFLVSSEVSTPFCWQFHSPYIVLPEYLIGFDPESVKFIVRHELEHLRTGHPLQLFLQRLVEALLWFHPLVWWASHQSNLHREFACDEAAVQSKSEIVEYLRTLLTIVEYNSTQKDNLPSVLSFSRGKQAIARRAERLVALASKTMPSTKLEISCPAAMMTLMFSTVLFSTLWIPLNVLASPRSNWSPWPIWSAGILHNLGLPVRDFEVFSQRTELDEMRAHLSQQKGTRK